MNQISLISVHDKRTCLINTVKYTVVLMLNKHSNNFFFILLGTSTKRVDIILFHFWHQD